MANRLDPIIPQLDNRALLSSFASILEELRARGVVRTSNNPVADYTEWLVCTKLGLRQESNSNKGFDATDQSGIRFEIKSRRVTVHNPSVQLSALRDLEARHFDHLIGVIYEADFSIRYAAKIPHCLVEPHCRFSKHANAHLLNLTPDILKLEGVEDISAVLAA